MKILVNDASFESIAFKKTLNGREHLVIPVVALKEGVFNGLFYSKGVLESTASYWGGVPVPVNHPMENKEYKTANCVDCENRVNIGRFYDPVFDKGRLKGDIWLDVSKSEELGYNDIVKKLDEGKMMEVSTGLIAQVDNVPGSHNGEKYDASVTDIRPDHLALLPTNIGACSIEDGCGAMRSNNIVVTEENVVMKNNDEKKNVVEEHQEVVVDNAEKHTPIKDVKKSEHTISDEEYKIFKALVKRENVRENVLRENVKKHYDLSDETISSLTIVALEEMRAKIKPVGNYAGQVGGSTDAVRRRVSSPILLLNEKENNND